MQAIRGANVSFIDYFKAAFELAKKAQSVELQSELLSMREDYNTMREENAALKDQVKLLEQAEITAKDLVYRSPAYYRKVAGGADEGPFCSRCWDVDRRLVRCTINLMTGEAIAMCQQCAGGNSRKR